MSHYDIGITVVVYFLIWFILALLSTFKKPKNSGKITYDNNL
jgi:hypothetical protein